MARTTSGRLGREPRVRKDVEQRLASHRIHSAASDQRKRDLGLIKVSVWIPGSYRTYFQEIAAAIRANPVEGGLRPPAAMSPDPKPGAKAPIMAGPTGTRIAQNPPRRRARHVADPRQLSLFDATLEGPSTKGGS
jgi:hypothetical protein